MPIKSNILTPEELNDVIAQETTNLIMLTDTDKKIVYVNKAFENVTGYSLGDCKGLKPSFLQGAETDTKVVKNISTSLSIDHRANEVICNYKRDGSKYWVNMDISPIYDAKGKLKHFIAIQSDVTDLIQAQHLEKSSRIKMRTLFDSSSNLKLVMSKDYQVIDFNLAASLFAEAITGESLKKDAPLKGFIKAGPWVSLIRNFIDCWENKLPLHTEAEIHLPNNVGRWFRINFNPVLEDNGKVEAMLIVLTDIEENKRNELKLLTQNQLLNGIADIYSHDVRGPVASLSGLLHLIDEGIEPVENVLKMMSSTIQKLDKTVQAITKLSTIAKIKE